MSLSASWLPPSSTQSRVLPSHSRLLRSDHAIHRAGHDQTSTSTTLDTSYLSTIQRRANELQQHLQDLLDAQSDQLTAQSTPNHAARPSSMQSSRSSLRPTNGKVIPIRQPPTDRSLSTIRHDIHSAMTELASLRNNESALLSEELHNVEANTANIRAWQTQRKRLEKEIDHLQQTPESTHLQKLEDDNAALDNQIEALEIQLAELQSRRRAGRLELEAGKNRVNATLSSYHAASHQLDRDVAAFLSSFGQSRDMRSSQTTTARWMSQKRGPHTQLTLDEAAEQVSTQADSLKEANKAATAEQAALTAGIDVWTEVLDGIRTFEKTLALHLRRRGRTRQSSAHGSASASMTDEEVLELMDQTMAELEARLAYVEEQGWNLLVCAIGAEVQAFGLGREMLAEMLGGVGGGTDDGVIDQHDGGTHHNGELGGSDLHRRRPSRDVRANILHDTTPEHSTPPHSPVITFSRTLPQRYAEGSGDDEPDDDMLGALQS